MHVHVSSIFKCIVIQKYVIKKYHRYPKVPSLCVCVCRGQVESFYYNIRTFKFTFFLLLLLRQDDTTITNRFQFHYKKCWSQQKKKWRGHAPALFLNVRFYSVLPFFNHCQHLQCTLKMQVGTGQQSFFSTVARSIIFIPQSTDLTLYLIGIN